MTQIPIDEIAAGFLILVDGKVWEVVAVDEWRVRVKDADGFCKSFTFFVSDTVMASRA